MANRNFQRVQALNHEVKLITGCFSIAASGGVATVKQGLGFSVAKSTTGVYVVTLQDSYVALLSANANVQAAVAVDLVPQIGAYDVSTAKTVEIKLLTDAVPTEPGAVCEVHFVLHLRNSTVA